MKKFNKILAIAAIAAASLFSVQTASAAKISDPDAQEMWETLQDVDISCCGETQESVWKMVYQLMIERIRDANVKISKDVADYLLEWGWVAGYNRDQVISYIGTNYEG